MHDDLKQLAADLGLADTVCFTGRLDNERISSLYASATVMLNPTTVDNMPISVLEALASGVSVVSTDVGGVPYLIEHNQTGLLVPSDDAEAMAGAVLRVLSDQNLKQTLIKNGIDSIKQYTWPQVSQKLFAVYRELLSHARTPVVESQRS